MHTSCCGAVHASFYFILQDSFETTIRSASVKHLIVYSIPSSPLEQSFRGGTLETSKAMEVFGTISPALSIIDVAIRSSNAIQELVTVWHDAPAEILALSNEINDSRVVLTQAHNLFQRIEAAPTALDDLRSCSVMIERQVEQAKPIWNRLDKLLREIKDDQKDPNKVSKSVKFRWLKNQSKVETLRAALKEKRLNIMQSMISSSAYDNKNHCSSSSI
jgi:hypothetical protein